MERNNKQLRLSSKDAWIAGVCGGLGEKFGIDRDLIRIVVVILFLCPTIPIGIIYIILWICMPTEKDDNENEKDCS